MDKSWISILLTVLFVVFPIVFGTKKKKGGDIFEDLEIDQLEEEVDEDTYVKPEIEVVEKKGARTNIEVEVKEDVIEKNEKEDIKVGAGMSKEEKKKLIVYSEVMSPKYKEY